MDDLFSNTRRTGVIDAPPEDYEYRLWAERVIREVSQEVANDERQARDFVRAWIRWRDLVALVSQLELNMHKRMNADTHESKWHDTFLSALISLGGLLREWSKGIDEQALELAGFESKRLVTSLTSLKESYEMWHGEHCQARTKSIQALLP